MLKNINIPKFCEDDSKHIRLAELSMDAHKNFVNKKKITEMEDQINQIICNLFDVDLDKIEKFYFV